MLTFATVFVAKAQQIAFHTNLLSDVCMVPSVGAEMVVGNNLSLDLSVTGALKPYGKDIKGIAVQPELRYWFSRRPLYQFYAGIGLIASLYDVKWAGKVYDNGQAIGGGLTFGYSLRLGNRVALLFHTGFGAVGYVHTEYFKGDEYDRFTANDGDIKTNAKGLYFLPTNIGVTLSYMIR